MDDMPRIQSVSPIGPTSLAAQWRGGRTSTVDLAEWLSRANPLMEPLSDPAAFPRDRRRVRQHGQLGGGEGDLAIDAEHLAMIAEEQARSKSYFGTE